MKKYLIGLGFFAASFVLLHIVLFLTQLGVATESSRWIYDSFVIKEDKAESIVGPKLMIIAGSNSLFSLSAEQISDEVGLAAVNCGTHAGLKIEYLLNRYLPFVNEGDIVLLPLEYDHYGYDRRTSETLADFVASRDPTWLVCNPKMFLNTAFAFSFLDLVTRNFKRFHPDAKKIGFYDASYLTDYGDKSNIRREFMSERQIDGLNRYSPLEIVVSNSFREVFKEFVAECSDRGATVLLSFPVTIGFEEYDDQKFQEPISEIVEFSNMLGVHVLGTPHDFFLPRENFLDTNYHADIVGREIATSRLIGLLNEFFDDKGVQIQRVDNFDEDLEPDQGN